jgi:hypothetical protein
MQIRCAAVGLALGDLRNASWNRTSAMSGPFAALTQPRSTRHAREFGVSKMPGGNPWASIARFKVMRELNMPRATKSGKRTILM